MFTLENIEGGVCAATGFYADGISIGLKKEGARDIAFIYSDSLCVNASVFTTNRMTAAPIRHFRQKGNFEGNFVLINSKNANAMTGPAGIEDIDEVLDCASRNISSNQKSGDEFYGSDRCASSKSQDHCGSDEF